MKKLVLALLIMQTAFLLAAPDKPKDKPNPADFAVTVHVVSSGSLVMDIGYCQVLETVIDGQPVELIGGYLPYQGVLALGDYPARISLSIRRPKNPNSYDIYRGYDFLMPDGKVRTYTVVRLGPAVPHP